MKQDLLRFVLQLGDTNHVLGHRLSEWCGHGPILEQDIAITNISLDLIGQARLYYQYAAEVEGKGRTEDDLAFLRDNREYYNPLLTEQPNGDWAHTIVRQFLYDSFHYFFLERLQGSNDERLAAIAAKSIKEVRYHLKYSSEWTIRLGDGTEESHRRMQEAAEDLWRYKGELTTPTDLERRLASEGIGVELGAISEQVDEKVRSTFREGTLAIPEVGHMQQGGKEGLHSEHLGYILADMQFMQRAYPGQTW